MAKQKKDKTPFANNKYFTHIEPKLDEIIALRQKGETIEAIADTIGVSYSTIRKWANVHKALKEALEVSKTKLANNVKKSLWKEAIGYEYEETETLIEESYLGTKKKIIKRKKYARPQSNLVIFALCNLLPEEFKRVDKEVVDDLKNKIDDLEDSVKNKIELSNSKVNEMLGVLYGKAIDESIKNKKELENK